MSPEDNDDIVQRANPPGIYTWPHCGEKLSGPARDYLCPGRIPVENLGRVA